MSSLSSETDCFYRQDPLPVYSFPERLTRIPKQAIPDDIKVWSEFHSPSLDYPTIEVLPETLPFHLSSPLPLSVNNLNDAQLSIVARGLTMHILQSNQLLWNYYEEICEDKVHLFSLRKKFFKIFASFALHIFDIEDFVRVVEKDMILKNAWEFCHDLEEKFGSDNLEELASGAMEDISTGKMDMEKFHFLWQLDVDFILGCYHQGKSHPRRDYVAQRVAYAYHNDIINTVESFPGHKHYVTTALEAIREHKPLQEGKKLDLLLNSRKRRCVLRQALYFEAWRGFEEDDLAKLYLVEHDPNLEETFITSFHETLNGLSVTKAGMVSFSEGVFRSPMECDTLGNFNKEVVEAVRIANFERMRLGYRFLTTNHLLFGLSRSRVGDKMKAFEKTWVPTPEVREFRDTNLLYCILRFSCDVATCLGLEEVLLEHLYIATTFATRLLPTKRIRTDDDTKQLIDWNSIFEQGVVTDFLKESAAEPERQSSGEMSEKVLWGHFFQEDCMPYAPKLMFKTLVGEFRKNNFNPLESCLSSTQNPNITTDATDSDDEISLLAEEGNCPLYSQYLYTLYAGCGMLWGRV